MKDTQYKSTIEHFEKLKIEPSCTVCKHTEIIVGKICTAPPFAAHSVDFSTPTIPMIPLICERCGHIMFYAAVPILGPNLEG